MTRELILEIIEKEPHLLVIESDATLNRLIEHIDVARPDVVLVSSKAGRTPSEFPGGKPQVAVLEEHKVSPQSLVDYITELRK